MSLSFGRSMVAIPGPSIIPDRVLNAMHRASPNIYAGDIADMTAKIKEDLAAVARTKGDALIYIGNGHGGWEAALSNTVNAGDHLLALSTGRFTKGWATMAEDLGAKIETIDFGTAAPIDPNKVEEALRADKNHKITAVLAVHVDTASSVQNDIPALRAAIDAANHPALLMVDCIASLGCAQFETDAWGVDVMVAACQKGLMTPPGLAFNFVNEKASARREHVTATTGYWDWRMRQNPEIYYMNFYGTAPTHHLFGLQTALEILLREEGIENTWRRHNILAQTVWAAVDRWSTGADVQINIANPDYRSNAVTTIHCKNADALREWTESRTGLTLGVGLDLDGGTGSQPEGTFRIGHMGHLNPSMILGTLATTQAGMEALGIQYGAGALEAAAKVIAHNA